MENFGIKAKVQLTFNGSIKELAKRLSLKLELPDFIFKADFDPPYEIQAMSGALGFQVWLLQSEGLTDSEFEFVIRSYAEVDSIFEKNLYDVSSWLSWYINELCEIKAVPKP